MISFMNIHKLSAQGIALILIVVFSFSPVWATCGGGGGGGGGGTSGNGGNGGGSTTNPVVYHVPWKSPMTDKEQPITTGLVLYWFPLSNEELQKSNLRESRDLSLYASQCVTMQLADKNMPNANNLVGDSKLPVVVLAKPDGTLIKKVENKDGKFKIGDVEKVVKDEIKLREAMLDSTLKDAKVKSSSGDNSSAIKLYQSVASEQCMFPKKAKEANKELKKLGVENTISKISAIPNFDVRKGALIKQLMKRGLIAENTSKYLLAEKLYDQAYQMDKADPTPLRYLGELHRHHTGDWEKAKKEFHNILDMPADPLSRAVALHGLGKITIHEGEFKKGLSFMEQSVNEYPLALTYRNLAVYWNSEGDLAKASNYADKAFALDPNDHYNHVFAAVLMAASGRKEEALKIARINENLLPASYNLAAIYALNGQRDKALDLLKRHFYKYERYQAVREKEMMEARVDAVFDSLRDDAAFLDLTKFADGKLPIPMSPRQMNSTTRMND